MWFVAWAWATPGSTTPGCVEAVAVGTFPEDGAVVPPDATFVYLYDTFDLGIPPCVLADLELVDGSGAVVPADLVDEGPAALRLVPRADLDPGAYTFHWSQPTYYETAQEGSVRVTVDPGATPVVPEVSTDLAVDYRCRQYLQSTLTSTTTFDAPFSGLVMHEFSAGPQRRTHPVVAREELVVVDTWIGTQGSEFCGAVTVSDVTGAVVYAASSCETFSCPVPDEPELVVDFVADCESDPATTRVEGTLTFSEVAPDASGTVLVQVRTELGEQGAPAAWFVEGPAYLPFGFDVIGVREVCVRPVMLDLVGEIAWEGAEICAPPETCPLPVRSEDDGSGCSCDTGSGPGWGTLGLAILLRATASRATRPTTRSGDRCRRSGRPTGAGDRPPRGSRS